MSKSKAEKVTLQQPKQQNAKYSIALQTARVIAQNKNHPKNAEVNELISAVEKGWVDQSKFSSLLQGMLF